MKLCTFHHAALGWLTLPRRTVRDISITARSMREEFALIEAAALLVLQSGE